MLLNHGSVAGKHLTTYISSGWDNFSWNIVINILGFSVIELQIVEIKFLHTWRYTYMESWLSEKCLHEIGIIVTNTNPCHTRVLRNPGNKFRYGCWTTVILQFIWFDLQRNNKKRLLSSWTSLRTGMFVEHCVRPSVRPSARPSVCPSVRLPVLNDIVYLWTIWDIQTRLVYMSWSTWGIYLHVTCLHFWNFPIRS